MDEVYLLALPLVELPEAPLLQGLGEAYDGVKRGPELVADVGQELALHLVRLHEPAYGALELMLLSGKLHVRDPELFGPLLHALLERGVVLLDVLSHLVELHRERAYLVR